LSARTALHAKLLLETAPEQSEASAKTFLDVARAVSGSVAVRSQRYWKIERYSEVSVAVELPDAGQQAFSRLMAAVGIGWTVNGSGPERSATWEGEGTAAMPALRWANLELFPASAAT
jgi:hypothetical protein